MKVYEVMNELSKMKSGAEVRINMIKTLDELPIFDNEDSRIIEFIVQEVTENDDYVNIDGWVE